MTVKEQHKFDLQIHLIQKDKQLSVCESKCLLGRHRNSDSQPFGVTLVSVKSEIFN